MNRARTLAVGFAVPCLIVAAITGSPVLMLLLVPVLVLGFGWARRGSGRGMADARWSLSESRSDATAVPAPVPRSGSFATVLALGRVEGRHLFWSPWFGIGLGFCAVVALMFAVIFADENNQAWAEWAQTAPWFVHPLVGMTVLASHSAVTRPHRDGTAEVLDVCPTRPETRTLGLLAASWTPMLVAVAFLLGFAVLLGWRATGMHGGLTNDNGGDLVGAVLLGAGGVALGVAIGRWVRFALTPVVVVLAIAFAATGVNGIGGHGWNPYTLLSTAPTIEAPSPVFADRPVWAHVLWIGALIALVVLIAVLRHRRDLGVVLAVVAVSAVAVIAARGATAEMPRASAERIASFVAQPEAHQECLHVGGETSVCMFPLHRALLERIASDTEPVASALPAHVGPLVIRQLYADRIDQLPPEVRRLLPDTLPERPLGELPFTDFDTLGTYTGARRNLAQAAVGLPTTPDDDLMPTVVAGQARGVVALWFSVRGLDRDDQIKRTTVSDPSSADPYEQASLDGSGPCSVPSVVWSAQDLAAVRAVIDLDDDLVSSVIATDWDRWVDPTTTTDEFLRAVGLPSLGPYDEVEPRRGEPC